MFVYNYRQLYMRCHSKKLKYFNKSFIKEILLKSLQIIKIILDSKYICCIFKKRELFNQERGEGGGCIMCIYVQKGVTWEIKISYFSLKFKKKILQVLIEFGQLCKRHEKLIIILYLISILLLYYEHPPSLSYLW